MSKTSHNPDSFEVFTINIVPQNEENIRSAVGALIQRDSVDWILVAGRIGFEDHECIPEVSRSNDPMIQSPFRLAHCFVDFSRAPKPLIERPALAIMNYILANLRARILFDRLQNLHSIPPSYAYSASLMRVKRSEPLHNSAPA